MTGLPMEGIAGPVVLGMGQYHRVYGEVGLSQHLRKRTRLQFFADHVISGAPGQKERDVVTVAGNVRDRRSVKVALAVVDQGHTEEFLRDAVVWPGHLLEIPFGCQVENTIDRDNGFYGTARCL